MKEQSIVIIDYGIGNVGSIRNMLKHVGFDSIVSSSTIEIEMADKLILSGVGAFDSGIRNLRRMGLDVTLNRCVLEKKIPILGICLGMQLLSERSEEGQESGLGWIKGETVRFQFAGQAAKDLRVPHMGWNYIEKKKESRLLDQLLNDSRFYFVHSYYFQCRYKQDTLCTTHHGFDFTSAVEKENIFGVQFHPEKSHRYGMQLLKNFAEVNVNA